MRVDRAFREIAAPADRIYRALVTRGAVETWLPPPGASGVIHDFEPTPGGAFRMTLTFEATGETGAGKSSANTDVVDGRFLELVPKERVRQRFTFNSEDPKFAGAMTMTWRLSPTPGGTRVTVEAEDVPVGISTKDHEAGMAASLENLAHYVARP